MNKAVSQYPIFRLRSQILLASLLIGLSMTVPICFQKSLALGQSTTHEQSADKTEDTESTDQEATKGTSQLIESLSGALRIYKAQPNAETWTAAWQNFKSLLWYVIVKHPAAQTAIKSIAPLNENGLKLTTGSHVKIWSFPKVADCQQVLVEWKEITSPPRQIIFGKRSHRKIVKSLPAVAVTKIQSAPCPPNTQIDDALIISGANQGEGSNKTGKSDSASYLVLTGVNRKTGSMWLGGYRLSEGSWVPNSEIFSEIPPYLSQNLQGKALFSGTNLVLTVEESKAGASASAASEKGSPSQLEGYKITFRLINMHYILDNRLSVDLSNDPPASIAVQFAQAVQKGRMDLVKAWLADPQLASIPNYLALYNRPVSAPAFKLVRMTSGTGSTRFRVVSFAKNDLILDIGKIKGQWLIKGLFIAPPDPLAKTLAGIVTSE